jgi:hypothetical protein
MKGELACRGRGGKDGTYLSNLYFRFVATEFEMVTKQVNRCMYFNNTVVEKG